MFVLSPTGDSASPVSQLTRVKHVAVLTMFSLQVSINVILHLPTEVDIDTTRNCVAPLNEAHTIQLLRQIPTTLPKSFLEDLAFIQFHYSSASVQKKRLALNNCFPQYELNTSDVNDILTWLSNDLTGQRIKMHTAMMSREEVAQRKKDLKKCLLAAGILSPLSLQEV